MVRRGETTAPAFAPPPGGSASATRAPVPAPAMAAGTVLYSGSRSRGGVRFPVLPTSERAADHAATHRAPPRRPLGVGAPVAIPRHVRGGHLRRGALRHRELPGD